MGWARLDDKRHTNHKLAAAGATDPIKGLAANGLDANGITYCSANETDGFVPDAALIVLAPGLGTRHREQLAGLLVQVGRWSRDDELGGWWVHDYLDFNPSRLDVEKKRAAERDRKASGRNRQGRDDRGRITSGRTPSGVPPGQQAESERKPAGSDAASDRIPRGVPPVPSRPVPSSDSSSSAEPLSRLGAADDDDVTSGVWRALAERDLADREATKGSVRNVEAWLAKAVERRSSGHGDELERLRREHPDWSVEQLAEALEPAPAPDSPYVPTWEETQARQAAEQAAFDADAAADAEHVARGDAAIAALDDDGRAELRARAEAEVTVVGGRRPEVLVAAAMRRLALEDTP